MRATVASMKATCQSSVQTLPRHFGKTDDTATALASTKAEQQLCAYDGGCELDNLRAVDDRNDIQQEFLDWAEDEIWKRPNLPLRDADGALKEDVEAAPRTSVYSKPLNAFAVSRYPKYRQIGVLREEPEANDTLTSSLWQKLFSADVRELVQEVLVHICGESWFKYSGRKVERICRHGFYYIIEFVADDKKTSQAGYRCRRRGKPLRNVPFVVKKNTHGLQKRLLGFQEQPFECQSNYGGVGALRCNLDVQDLRRVLPTYYWMDGDDQLPHLGNRFSWGYMNKYQWNGEEYEERPDLKKVSRIYGATNSSPRNGETSCWNFIKTPLGGSLQEDCEEDDDGLEEATVSFSDGINTGFYIYSYTTKHCPSMDGVLEELRKGIARLTEQRGSEAFRLTEVAEEATKVLNCGAPIAKKKSAFAETLASLSRLQFSYRRWYWKSRSEMLFPVLYGQLIYASHRC